MKNLIRLPRQARRALFLPALLALALFAPVAVAQTIPNPSFELNPPFTNFPGYSSGNATITGWTANDLSRVGLNPGTNFSPFADNGAIPNGARVAFIQSLNGEANTLSTTITGLTVGTWYRVQFRTNCRGQVVDPVASYRINGGPSVSFVAAPTVNGSNPYYTITAIFQATATTAPLEISNSTSGDSTVLLDDFKITAATPIVVMNNTDAAAGSLRAALATANSGANATNFNVITFAAGLNGGTITLSSEILVNDASGVAIDASALSNGITLHGGSGDNRVLHHAAGSVAALRRLTLTSGNPTFGDGGGIFNEGILSVTQCAMKENTAPGNGGGGGVGNAATGTISLSQCTLSRNLGADGGGGGMANYGTAFLSQCTFSGNDSPNYGSAMFNSGKMTLKHVTIANNVDTITGTTPGMTNFAQLTVESCIFAGNQVGDLVNSGGTLTRSGSNIIRVFSQSGGTNSGPAAITSDPLLSPLASNGGPTQTMAIGVGSPARNAAVGSTITTDQRGLPVVSTPDLGAFEMQGNSSFTLIFGPGGYVGNEGGMAEVVIDRGTSISGTSTVRLFTTAGVGATGATAADFTARPNTAASDVTFLDGETFKIVAIPLTGDQLAEGDETFTVTIVSPAPAGATVGTPATATVTIKNAFVVLNTNDSGGGSLRQALDNAATTPGPDAISFAPAMAGKTITLVGELVVDDSSGAVTVDASSIGGITVSGGGNCRLFSVGASTHLILRRLTLAEGNGNGAQLSGKGGAILKRAGATVTLAQCTLRNNAAASDGGAIYNEFGASNGLLLLTQCTLSSNSAAVGGAICNVSPAGEAGKGTLLEQCTLWGNIAANGGGAIINQQGVTKLVHCTITGNTAPAGLGSGVAGIGDSLTQTIVEKCIVSANTNSSVDFGAGVTNSFTSAGGNVIGSGNATAAFIASGDVINDTPGLSTLANHGGPTETCALQPGSPALDRATGSVITSDQRGFNLYGPADSGAYEAQQGGAFVVGVIPGTVVEGQSAAFDIFRGNDFRGPAKVRFFTTTGTAGSADFTGRPNTTASDLDFIDGEDVKPVPIATTPDTLVEGTESFTATLGLAVAPARVANGSQTVPTTIRDASLLVTTLNDDGPGSLRQAIAAAAARYGPDFISFAAALNGQTITLGSEIDVEDADGVTVDASNLSAGITIDGGPGTNRIFYVGNLVASDLTLRRLTLTGGNCTGTTYPANDGNGCAIFNGGSSHLVLERCTLHGNTSSLSGYGGAISNFGDAELTQCTLSGNKGGILNYTSSSLILTHCTFTGNSALDGAGVYNMNQLTLNRCIVFGNFGNSDFYSQGTHTLVGTSISTPPTGAGISDGSGTINNANPLLGPLANNGGPTKTHALTTVGVTVSPAVDAGGGSTITTDQRGLPIIADADIGAYEVQLGGTFVLASTGYAVTEGQQATVRINRVGNTQGTATVRFFTANGTAIAGADYTARPNTAASDVFFNDGESFKDINISITPEAVNVVEPNETFTVSLGSPSTFATLGTPSSATISIKDPSAGSMATDPAAPTVAITTPAASANVGVDPGGVITLTGIATDNKGVQSVTVSFNGVNFGFAALDKPNAPSTGFTLNLGPSQVVAGLNTVTVQAKDAAGRTSAVVTRTFKVLRPLLVGISGSGSVTAGYAPKSYREVGKPYTITATAGTGAFFAGWTILSGHTATQLGLSVTALEKNAITFIHLDANGQQPLALMANFVPNPYNLANTGTFNGAIKPSPTLPPGGTPSGLSTEGYISMLVQTTGAFSGSMKIDGMTLAVAGTFDHTGAARFGTNRVKTLSVARVDKPSLAVSLNINTSTGKITGTIWQFEEGSVVAVSDVDANRAFFSATNPVPPTDFGASGPRPATGSYTALSLMTGGGAGLTSDQIPDANGYATVTLSSAGVLMWTGMLPDKTPITFSTTISEAGTWRLFCQLYPSLQGFFSGDFTLDHSQSGSDFASSNIHWVCPLQDRQHYPLGWTDGLSGIALGSKVTITDSPVKLSSLPSLPATGSGHGNATLTLHGGLQTPTLTKQVDVSPADGVTEVPNDINYTLSITRTTGSFQGTFMHSGGATVPFGGVIFQKDPNVSGRGFFMSPTPAVKTYNGKCGDVTLIKQ